MSTPFLISVPAPPKSKSQQLAKLLPNIEAALIRGYSHEVIHEHIKNFIGLDLSYRYYKLTLHRVRKNRDKAQASGTSRASHRLPSTVVSVTASHSDQVVETVAAQSDGKFKYDVHGSIAEFF